MTKKRCAAGVRNLTCFNGGEAKIMQQGALFALIDLSVSSDAEVKRHVGEYLARRRVCLVFPVVHRSMHPCVLSDVCGCGHVRVFLAQLRRCST